MSVRIPRSILTGAIVVVVSYALLGTEVQCTPAEARPSLESLQAQIDEISADLDSFPVVLDATDKLVGFVIGTSNPQADFVSATVQFDLPSLPLFTLSVEREAILGNAGNVFFGSTDCSGAPWIELISGRPRSIWAPTLFADGMFYVADPSDTPSLRHSGSNLHPDGTCTEFSTPLDPAIQAIPVDLASMFTPPFRVVTRGDLNGP